MAVHVSTANVKYQIKYRDIASVSDPSSNTPVDANEGGNAKVNTNRKVDLDAKLPERTQMHQ